VINTIHVYLQRLTSTLPSTENMVVRFYRSLLQNTRNFSNHEDHKWSNKTYLLDTQIWGPECGARGGQGGRRGLYLGCCPALA